jgi:hypothetical protein
VCIVRSMFVPLVVDGRGSWGLRDWLYVVSEDVNGQNSVLYSPEDGPWRPKHVVR